MLTANDVLQAIGWLYIGIAALAVALTLVLAKGARRKALLGLVVLGLFAIWPVVSTVQTRREANDHAAKVKPAHERFEMRCKSAGEKITRTVENVEGVFLMRLRSRAMPTWFEQRDTPYDVFAAEDGGDAMTGSSATNYKERKPRPDNYILSFLRPQVIDPPSAQTVANTDVGRYQYVEAIDPSDGKLYRYTARSIQLKKLLPEYGDWVREVMLDREPIDQRRAKYGVTWQDLTEPADRAWWIAGSSVRIVDLTSGDVIAERTGYVMDFAQGDKTGFRSPWAFARPCVTYEPAKRQTRYFVEQVLKPIQGE